VECRQAFHTPGGTAVADNHIKFSLLWQVLQQQSLSQSTLQVAESKQAFSIALHL